jgi:uncharacterized protein YbjQ (UPF0145 family)
VENRPHADFFLKLTTGATTMKMNILGVLAVIILAGCATGTALVTGEKRAPISPDQVRIFNSPPAQFEVIATVQAQSDAGMTMQQKQDSALEELKAQAAKVGANGLLIGQIGEQVQTGSTYVPMASGGYIVPGAGVKKAYLSGTAIYVP